MFKGKLTKDEEDNFIKENDNKNITGYILNLKFIKKFSIKFYKAIKRLGKLVEGKKEPGTAFVYSNLVRAGGMEVFAEALLQNGYLEYKENYNDYSINDNTLDYKTGKTYGQFKKSKMNLEDFRPATYLLITGSTDETGEDIPEVKQKIVREVFNNPNNIDGKNIKLVLGSQVMNEGITLKNVKEVHILDVHFNLGRVDQVIVEQLGGALIKILLVKNRFPRVRVYRYVVAKKKRLLQILLIQKSRK